MPLVQFKIKKKASKRSKAVKQETKLSKRQLSSPTRGWSKQAPKLRSERKTMLSKCGSKCFLLPTKMKFPICSKNTCKLSCKGIVSAKIRASQWKYRDVAKQADRLIQRKKCTQASRG